jgi:FkbM family methyltransferase
MSWAGALHDAVARTANGLTRRDNWLRRALTPAYNVLLYALSLGRGVPRAFNGEEFLVDPRVRHLLLEHHEPAVARYLRDRVRAGDICMNVGANLGLYALPLARWCGPAGRVIAFEANPRTAAILTRHVRMNALETRVRVEAIAVGAVSGRAELFDTRPGSGISRIGAAHPYYGADMSPSIEVPIVSLDEYCAAKRVSPDWLVIDVEGFEFEVLRGARETILKRRSGLSILVEIHPYLWDSSAGHLDEATTVFRELHRRPLALDGTPAPLDRPGVLVLEPVD